jgi:hypothetical protein
MYTIFYALLTIFWVLDIFNLPFMEVFDTTYQINGWLWFFIWIFLPTPSSAGGKL